MFYLCYMEQYCNSIVTITLISRCSFTLIICFLLCLVFVHFIIMSYLVSWPQNWNKLDLTWEIMKSSNALCFSFIRVNWHLQSQTFLCYPLYNCLKTSFIDTNCCNVIRKSFFSNKQPFTSMPASTSLKDLLYLPYLLLYIVTSMTNTIQKQICNAPVSKVESEAQV